MHSSLGRADLTDTSLKGAFLEGAKGVPELTPEQLASMKIKESEPFGEIWLRS